MNIKEFYKILKAGEDYREIFLECSNGDSVLIKSCKLVGNILFLYTTYSSTNISLHRIYKIGDLIYFIENNIIFEQMNNITISVERNFDICEIEKVENSLGEVVIKEKEDFIKKLISIFNL